MTNKVWMVGMMLIAFVIGMLFSQNTTAQESNEIGRYQISGGSSDLSYFVWKIDTVTGEVSKCQGGGSLDSLCAYIGR